MIIDSFDKEELMGANRLTHAQKIVVRAAKKAYGGKMPEELYKRARAAGSKEQARQWALEALREVKSEAISTSH